MKYALAKHCIREMRECHLFARNRTPGQAPSRPPPEPHEGVLRGGAGRGGLTGTAEVAPAEIAVAHRGASLCRLSAPLFVTAQQHGAAHGAARLKCRRSATFRGRWQGLGEATSPRNKGGSSVGLPTKAYLPCLRIGATPLFAGRKHYAPLLHAGVPGCQAPPGGTRNVLADP